MTTEKQVITIAELDEPNQKWEIFEDVYLNAPLPYKRLVGYRTLSPKHWELAKAYLTSRDAIVPVIEKVRKNPSCGNRIHIHPRHTHRAHMERSKMRRCSSAGGSGTVKSGLARWQSLYLAKATSETLGEYFAVEIQGASGCANNEQLLFGVGTTNIIVGTNYSGTIQIGTNFFRLKDLMKD